MTKPYKDQIAREQLWFERHCASVLLQAIADSGLMPEDIDVRLGRKAGFTSGFLSRLLHGRTGVAKEVVMLMTAMDRRLIMGYRSLGLPEATETDVE